MRPLARFTAAIVIHDRFYSEAGAMLIRQLSDAAADVGSYWLTSWMNAGHPALPRQ